MPGLTHRPRPPGRRASIGFTLIEVLVTMALILIGLLGMFALQVRAANVELESYQRGQALALAREMESRLHASRSVLAGFLDPAVSSTDGSVYVGTGSGAKDHSDDGDCELPTPASALETAKFQACQWAEALQGAAAQDGGNNVGAMIGARGCLLRVNPPQDNALADFYVVVVWQGVAAGSEPPADAPAGQNVCASDVAFGAGMRRGVSLRVLVPNLTKAS